MSETVDNSVPPLFTPLQVRGLTLANRVWMPPMCQYQAVDGVPNEWHLVHYGARAQGGFGLMIAEATGVVPEGRISTACCGLWNQEQEDAWTRIVRFAHAQGAKMGIQLVHAGRKAGTYPWLPDAPVGTAPAADGGWEPVGPSPIAAKGLDVPRELSIEEVAAIPGAFAAAAQRAVNAGFDTVQIHAAHGYLLHQFLSPASNQRMDEYGGSFENRTRLLLEVVAAVRAVLPEDMPLMLRISATDWLEDGAGWTAEDTVRVTAALAAAGVDFMDVSSGGNVPASIPAGPRYQVPFATQVKETGMITSAVGMIATAEDAADIVASGLADAVNIGRAALADPYFARHAAKELGVELEKLPSYWRGL